MTLCYELIGVCFRWYLWDVILLPFHSFFSFSLSCFDCFTDRLFFSSTSSAIVVMRSLSLRIWLLDGNCWTDGWQRHALPMYIGTQENAARENFLFLCDWIFQRPARCTATRRCNARSSFLLLIKSGKSRHVDPTIAVIFGRFLFFHDDQRETKSAPFRSVRPGCDDPKADPPKFVAMTFCRSIASRNIDRVCPQLQDYISAGSAVLSGFKNNVILNLDQTFHSATELFDDRRWDNRI